MKDYNTELEFAKKIARDTWPLISGFYDLRVKPEFKKDNTPVTIADKKANEFITSRIKEFFPEDSIVSEEDPASKTGRRTWYIDPIDGTKGFIKRNGHFVIHIGFCEEEHPALGVVYHPTSEEIYFGGKGIGAWRENKRGIIELKVDPNTQGNLVAITNCDIVAKDLRPIYESLGVTNYHNSGSEGLRIMKLAENIASIRITEAARSNTWDLCAPQAVFEAAGGNISYIDGSKIIYQQQSSLNKRYVAANSQDLLEKSVSLLRRLLENKS